MTAACGGASSQPRSYAPAVAFLAGEVAVALMVETFGLSAVWASLLAYAVGTTVDTASMCATDPPAVPSFTLDDINHIINDTPYNYPAAFTKLNQLTVAAAWWSMCECVGVATPAPPAGPTYPSGAPVLNPPGIPGRSQGACWDHVTALNEVAVGGSPTFYDLADQLLPNSGVPIAVNPWTAVGHKAYPIPAGANHLSLVINPSAMTGYNGYIRWCTWNAAGTTILDAVQVDYGTINQGPQHRELVAINASAVYWSVGVGDGAPVQTVPETYAIEVSFFCSGQSPSSPVQDCCPPDPILMGQIGQILNLLNGIYRGLPPLLTSYGESTVHSGLNNGGSFALGPGAIGIRVDITTDNATLRTEPSNPDYLFDRGFIVPIAAEGPIRGQTRLVYNPQLYQLPPLTERIGYQLGAGIIARITELTRGP